MSLVSEVYAFNNQVQPNAFGVEIELENVAGEYQQLLSQCVVDGLVRLTDDGSLRNNGVEFVTRPITSKEELARIVQAIQESYPHAVASLRCGVHVHMNVRDMTFEQLGRFVTLYTLVENIIMLHTGERGTNHFCVPTSQTDLMTPHLRMWKSGTDVVNSSVLRSHKYAAMNLKPVADQGTVEARMLAGEFWNTSKLPELIDVMFRLKELAMTPMTKPQFKHWLWEINAMSAYEHFLSQVFGNGLLGVDVLDDNNHSKIRNAVFLFKCANRG